MRIPKELDPKTIPILYHYCSAEAFLSVVQSGTIRFSDINTLNDYAESHWAYDRFIEAANQVLDKVGRDFIDKLDKILSVTQLSILPFIFCLSKDGDVLSQWRAYAEDGTGVSIGFDSQALVKLGARTSEILYDRQSQVDHFKSYILSLYEVESGAKSEDRNDFLIGATAAMGADFACFKNPAFVEEAEVRLIRAVNVVGQSHEITFLDPGASGGTHAANESQEIKFRARKGELVMHIDLPFFGLGDDVIKEVILGPKSPNQGPEVIGLLNKLGFRGFSIKRSSATYR